MHPVLTVALVHKGIWHFSFVKETEKPEKYKSEERENGLIHAVSIESRKACETEKSQEAELRADRSGGNRGPLPFLFCKNPAEQKENEPADPEQKNRNREDHGQILHLKPVLGVIHRRKDPGIIIDGGMPGGRCKEQDA